MLFLLPALMRKRSSGFKVWVAYNNMKCEVGRDKDLQNLKIKHPQCRYECEVVYEEPK